MVNNPSPGSLWCAWCLAAGAGDISTTATLSAECGHAVGGQICLAFTEICEFPASNQLVKLKPCLLCAEEQTWDGSFLHSSPLSPARWAPNICLLDSAFAPCSFIMQQTSASTAQDLMCSRLKKKQKIQRKEHSEGRRKEIEALIYMFLTDLGINIFLSERFVGLYFFIPVMLSCTVNCWLFSHALDLLDMCQVVSLLPLAFVSTLQTAGKNIFFPSLSLFFSLLWMFTSWQLWNKFWTVAVPIDSSSLMLEKGGLFPPSFWHILAYHLTSYPDASKLKQTKPRGKKRQKEGEGINQHVHTAPEPPKNTRPSVHHFSPFVLSLLYVFLNKMNSWYFDDISTHAS